MFLSSLVLHLSIGRKGELSISRSPPAHATGRGKPARTKALAQSAIAHSAARRARREG